MNLFTSILSHPAATALGWTLLHSLWQGAAVASVLGISLRSMRRSPVQARYTMAYGALAVSLLLPLATFGYLLSRMPGPVSEAESELELESAAAVTVRFSDPAQAHLLDSEISLETTPWIGDEKSPIIGSLPAGTVSEDGKIDSYAQGTEAHPIWVALREHLRPILPWIVLAWGAGVILLSAIHAGGWMRLQRLRLIGVLRAGEEIEELAHDVGRKLGLTYPVRVMVSCRIPTPGVVGWLRPVVLLPWSCLSSLSMQDLEAILAHELAHVLRRDYIANMVQSAAEVLLFYHPATWWISSRIRLEREFCCDDLAVGILRGNVGQYSKALLSLAEQSRSVVLAKPALAATGGRLVHRIRRLLQSPAISDSSSWGARAALLLPALVIALAGLFQVPVLGNIDQTPAKEEAKASGALDAHQAPPSGVQIAVHGTIRMAGDSPATSATVELLSAEPGEPARRLGVTSTSLNGDYRLTAADRDSVLLRVSAPGSPSLTGQITIARSAPDRRPQEGTRVLRRDVRLTTSSDMRGVVLEANGAPATGVQVRVVSTLPGEGSFTWTSETTTTLNSRGEYWLQDVPAGSCSLIASSPRHPVLITQAAAPETTRTLRLRERGGTVEGAVFLYPDGTPLTSATVVLSPRGSDGKLNPLLPELTTLTDSLGMYRFSMVAAGLYQLRAQRDGLFPHREPDRFALAEGESTGPLEVHLSRGYSVRGRVLEWGTRRPLAGATVSLTSNDTTSPEAQSDEDGNFRLDGISLKSPGGNSSQRTIWLECRKDGYAVETGTRQTGVSVWLPEDRLEVEAEIEMRPVPSVSGTVRTPDGDPLAGAEVRRLGHLPSGKSMHPFRLAVTDEQGRYTVPAEPEMVLRLVAEAPGYAPSNSDLVRLDQESTSGVDIILKRGGTISGAVVDTAGKGIPGVEVEAHHMVDVSPSSAGRYLFGDNLPRVLTDDQGSFLLKDVPAGQVDVHCAASSGLAAAPIKVTLEEGESTSGLRLITGTKNKGLTIWVKDLKGSPLKHVEVAASRAGSALQPFQSKMNTGENGGARLISVPEGPILVTATLTRPTGSIVNSVRVEKAEGQDVEIVLDTPAEPPPVAFVGRVVDEKSGLLLSDYSVTADRQEAVLEKRSQEPGVFRIHGVRPGYKIELKVKSPGRAPLTEVITMPYGQSKVERTFRLGAGGTVRGRVVERTSRLPKKGILVEVLEGTRQFDAVAKSTVTAEDGEFEMTSLPVREVSIRFRDPVKARLESESQGPVFTVEDGGRMRFRAGTEDAGIVAAEQRTLRHGDRTDLGEVLIGSGPTLRGQVLRGGKPERGLKIELRLTDGGRAGESVSDEHGRFVFSDLLPKEYHLYADTGSHGLNANVSLETGQDREVTLRLGSAELQGRITLRGNGVEAYVNLQRKPSSSGDTPQSHFSTTSADGTYEFRDLDRGTWEVHAYRIGGGRMLNSTRTTIELKESEIVERDLALPSGRVTGTVVDEQDAPIANARVSIKPIPSGSAQELFDSQRSPETYTDSVGAFSLNDLSAGRYSLLAQKDKVGFSAPVEVAVPENSDTPSQLLVITSGEVGTLVSTALSLEDGRPIPKAWCHIYGKEGEIPHGKSRESDGVMEISGLAPGEYRVSVSAWGYSVSEKTVTIEAGKTTRIDDVLYSAGSMEWTLLDANAKPIAGAKCLLSPEDPSSIEPPREGLTDAQGQFTARGLAPGKYTARAELSDGGDLQQGIEISAKGHAAHITRQE